jgi:Transposase DDE domain
VGWHPRRRINQQGKFRPQGGYQWVPFTTRVPAVGRWWQGRGTAFTGRDTPLECTLLGSWGAGYQDAWRVLTDLPPPAAQAGWYGLRAGIEPGFKRLKSGGWQWQYTRLEDPARAERLWLALALATWWVVSVGGEAEANLPVVLANWCG